MTYPEVDWANRSEKKIDFIVSTSEITCLAYISLLQAHKISNKSDPLRIVKFNGSINHKNFRNKILGFLDEYEDKVKRYCFYFIRVEKEDV